MIISCISRSVKCSRNKIPAVLLLIIILPVVISYGSEIQIKNNRVGQETVVHAVKKNDTVFSIAKKYQVTTSKIRKWNKLKGNNITVGQKLIVGYSKKKKAAEGKAVKKKVVPPPKAVKPIPEVKKVKSSPAQRKVEPETGKEKIQEPVNVEMKNISEEGTASWIDDDTEGKYYALHRTAPVGTIIKVTNPANKKSVYVKVVGKIPAREEFAVIIIQLSKAASDKLEVSDARFNAALNYSVPE